MKQKTIEALHELSVFFGEHCDLDWKKKVDEKIQQVSTVANDEEIPVILKDLFGTYGTLNDIAILKANGHKVQDEIAVNEKLEKLIGGLKMLLSQIDKYWYKH